jgi:cytoskeleton protein RodZ
MTDDLTSAGEPADRAAAAGPDTEPQSMFGPASAGGMIRAARQAQGIDLASLAAMLKIPLRRLDALENSRHDELQGPTFERALAQAACRVLKIDPKPVLGMLPQNERNTLERVSEGINAPFRERQGGAGLGEISSTVFRPAVIVTALIALAALALFYFPADLWTRMTGPVVAALSSHASAEVVPPAAAVATVAAVPVDAGQAASAVLAPASGAAVAAPPVPASSEATSAAAAVSATAAQDIDEVLAHVAAPNIPLQVVASADSWIEVVDAQGRPLLSRTVLAGETVGLDGALPMRVKIGNAKATKIKLRGDNVDLTPWTHDNVARLELK